MRKTILLLMVSLDGAYIGPGEGFERIDWHHVEDEWEDYSSGIMDDADMLLFGRRTYG